MAISRMNMERQMRNMGGIMGLEDQRQGYFLGKLVKKAKRAVKKVVKSPLGKAALLGGLGAYGLGALGGKSFALKNAFNLANMKAGLGSVVSPFLKGGKLSTIGDIFRVGGEAGKDFSALRLLGGGLGAAAIAAPFFMGGDDEEVDEGVDFTGVQPMVANIRNQARRYYTEPASRADLGLYFMPQQQFTRPFAEGGLADIPREGYESGGITGILKLLSMLTPAGAAKKAGKTIANMDADTLEKLSMMTPVGAAKKAGQSLANMDTDILKRISMFTPFGAGRELARKLAMKNGGDVMMASNMENDRTLENLLEKYLDMGLSPAEAEKAAREEFERMTKQPSADRTAAAEGGLMDLGGMEKDYREGGFVPIGAKERADDVPARLSKNEFVFTADAVRNAGGGDIDKGAEVMQNMMDNLEAGGTISEESQGMENPAQAMFDQAQMLEGRLV